MFAACEKELSPNLSSIENSRVSNKKLTTEEINQIRKGYKDRQNKNNIFEGEHTEYVPMQNALDIFEVVLNSEYAVRYDDQDYDLWELDVFDFELEFTNVNSDYLFNLPDVYINLQEIEEFIQERDLSNGPNRKFITIDVEPIEVVGESKFRFTYTTISARVTAKSVEKVEDYYEFNWLWGTGDIYDAYGNKPLFGCYPDDQNQRTKGVGGACGVISANLNKYYFSRSGRDKYAEICQGTYSTSIKTIYIHQGGMSGFRNWYRNYDEDGLLMAYVQDLPVKCVSGAELRDVWVPYIIDKAKEEKVIDKNPYKVRRGSEDNIRFQVVESGSWLKWNQQIILRWEDIQCKAELAK